MILLWIFGSVCAWIAFAALAMGLCAMADEERYPTPKPPKRYVAPGDDLYPAYKSWGGKGAKF